MQLCHLVYTMQRTGVQYVIHNYFLFIGSLGSSQYSSSLSKALQICATLGMLVALHMIDSTSTLITLQGVEIDTVACQLSLAELKLLPLNAEIAK